MATFDFFTITPQQALNFTSADLLLTLSGTASGASVVFNGPADNPTSVTITLQGHSVEFGPAVQGDAFLFNDASFLVVGNAGADHIDRAGANAIFGGAGDDSLVVHGGNNLLQGNQGNDSLIAGDGSDTIYGGQGNDVIVSGPGTAADHGDTVNGNKGDDSITGGSGGDVLLGGQGSDSIQGGAGADYLSGDLGNDTLAGGAGADTFRGFAQGGDDRIVDFQQGDLVLLDHGSTFDVVHSGADTLILIDHGSATITLVGVDFTTLQGSWIGVA